MLMPLVPVIVAEPYRADYYSVAAQVIPVLLFVILFQRQQLVDVLFEAEGRGPSPIERAGFAVVWILSVFLLCAGEYAAIAALYRGKAATATPVVVGGAVVIGLVAAALPTLIREATVLYRMARPHSRHHLASDIVIVVGTVIAIVLLGRILDPG
jgi:hypothetical protein